MSLTFKCQCEHACVYVCEYLGWFKPPITLFMQQNFHCHGHTGIAVSVKISGVHIGRAMRSEMLM